MSAFYNYALYGLCIRSELRLTALAVPETQTPDLTVRFGEDCRGGILAPAGQVWAKADFGNGFGVQLTKTDDGWSLFYPKTGEFRFTSDLLTATAHAMPGRVEILPLLLAGSVLSW